MAASQYNKRFITRLRTTYLRALPVMLLTTLLFNHYLFSFYYEFVLIQHYENKVEQVKARLEKDHQLPALPNVTYRKLPRTAQPHVYLTQRDISIGDAQNQETSYVSTFVWKGEQYEITITQIIKNKGHGPGTVILLSATLLSLFLFLLLNWAFFQFNIKRVAFNLWNPFYQNLRRINAYRIRDNKPLVLSQSEIREFEAFNQAILEFTQNTQRAYNQLREFTENTAHELQTPLTVLLTKIQLLLKRNSLSPEDTKELLDVKKMVQRLSGIHKGLTLLSRIRSMQYGGGFDKNDVPLHALVHESLALYEELIDYKRIQVDVQALPAVHLLSNGELVRILIDNLIRNAVQHNVPNGCLVVTLTASSLDLRNTGPDRTESTENLFSRYQTSSQDNGRLGLGLAIVEAICETLGFTYAYAFVDSLHSFRVGWSDHP